MGIKVLDCTLRDGAYIVNGKFGEECIAGIIHTLRAAGVDIVECGWLRQEAHTKDDVFFNCPSDLKADSQSFALMLDYGKYDLDKLDLKSNIGIIRIAFYKEDLDKISFAAEKIKTKGYRVFLQASNTIDYNEKELEKLCKRANFVGADAIYIVDSFGSMFPEDLERLINTYDELIGQNIEIGFHSHNNIQLSFALAIQFINKLKDRNIIVDSSLCGIGRGAGNVQTELLLEYLKKQGEEYNTEIIWQGIEEYIEPLYKDYSWQYTPQKGFKGINKLHPNTILNNYTI